MATPSILPCSSNKCGIGSRGTASHWNHAPIIHQNPHVAPQCTLYCTTVPDSSGIRAEGDTSQSRGIDAPVKAECSQSQVTTQSNNASNLAVEMYWRRGGRGEKRLPQETTDRRRPGLVLRPSITKNQDQDLRKFYDHEPAATMCNEWAPPDRRVRL